MGKIILTMGDPGGIGAEVCVKALADPSSRPESVSVLFGDARVAAASAEASGIALPFPVFPRRVLERGLPSVTSLVDFDNVPDTLRPGTECAAGGQAALAYLEAAVPFCLSGEAKALVTAPISKKAIALAGSPFPGHTEMLAALSGGAEVLMAFHLPEFWTVLATTHVPLGAALAACRREKVESVIRRAWHGLQPFGRPKALAVAGINPHASEDGLLGSEEAAAIEPAVAACRSDGLPVAGPFPADTVFLRARRGEFDVVIAHYHDQGLIPVKLLGPGRAVNVTLGLPFPRMSPAHGTAFDIAGQGAADPSSLAAALRLALKATRTPALGHF